MEAVQGDEREEHDDAQDEGGNVESESVLL